MSAGKRWWRLLTTPHRVAPAATSGVRAVMFADDRHGFPVMELPLGVGFYVRMIAVLCDEVIDEFQWRELFV
jgi:hypothetical protein